MKKISLKIGWLYPDLMNTYGDRGNIISLIYRAKRRGIKVKLIKISLTEKKDFLASVDLIFMGGAQDRQQEIVNQDLLDNKGSTLKELIEKGIPGIYVCGAYQFLGNYYKAADGKIINGLGIFDLYTESPGVKAKRLIGDIIIKPYLFNVKFVGFENHTGRTFLGKNINPFSKVIKGYGNNGQDKLEGAIYKNSMGTYLHGPILPKNPELTDWLIRKSIEKKYNQEIQLEELDDDLEKKARKKILYDNKLA